ncbi:AraC family transcriptional regulator [Maribacter halichondriae]|uniref:AraC family transcriptional regulator n=1 Tax=Maribacter halichondriae TaxID=2980554 RepID=UPI002358225A|nr:helix-turn-helix domain-containing protein [Maribacter sp. Hal144]
MANILLGIYTFLFAFELLNNSLRWSGDIYAASFVHLNLAHFPLWTVYGAIVFIYTRKVIDHTGFIWRDLLFLVPPTTTVSMLYPFYALSSQEKVKVVLEGRTYDYAYFPNSAIWIVIAIMFFYAAYTYFNFWRNKKVGFRENKWLKWFVGSYFGFVLLFALYIFLVRFGLMNPDYDYLVDIAIVGFIGMLSFFGFVQPEIFEGKSIKEVLPFVKYRKTGLSEALSLEMKAKLLRIMEEREPYLDNDLRLDDLSMLMNLSRNHTSQIINEHFNLSFFDFVNQYRIKDAKNLLLQNKEDHRTITQIAYDVGFNNRASFYKAFKKFSDGRSPSDYAKQMHAS